MDFFEPLLRAGVLENEKLDHDSLNSLSFSDLLDLLDQVCHQTTQLPEKGATSHTAPSSMAGDCGECAWIECRLERIEELGRFAALYSDGVSFHNFLAQTAPSFGHYPDEDSEDLRRNILFDLEILLRAKPLIEAGLLVPYSTPTAFCISCLAKSLLGKRPSKRLVRAIPKLSKELLEDISVEVSLDEDEFLLDCEFPLYASSHGNLVFSSSKDIKYLSASPRLMARLARGKTIKASKKLLRELDLHGQAVREAAVSSSIQLAISQLTESSMLIHRDLDRRVINELSSTPAIEENNFMMANHMSALIPVAEGVSLKNIVTLRRRHPESFIRFRSILKKSLQEITSRQQPLTPAQAKEFYRDCIAPEIARLEQAVSEARRGLVSSPLRSVIAVGATLVAGIHSGLLSGEVAIAAQNLGLAKIAYDTTRKATEAVDTTREIRTDPFYFLWKLEKKKRKDLNRLSH